MAIEQWELSLRHLKDKVGVTEDKVEGAYRKMIVNPSYDSYADLSTAAGNLNSLMATIEGMKKYESITPKGISLQRLQDEVVVIQKRVERTRKTMLQDSSYEPLVELGLLGIRLDDLYATIEDAVERIERGEE